MYLLFSKKAILILVLKRANLFQFEAKSFSVNTGPNDLLDSRPGQLNIIFLCFFNQRSPLEILRSSLFWCDRWFHTEAKNPHWGRMSVMEKDRTADPALDIFFTAAARIFTKFFSRTWLFEFVICPGRTAEVYFLSIWMRERKAIVDW